jgi:hypothetical protein
VLSNIGPSDVLANMDHLKTRKRGHQNGQLMRQKCCRSIADQQVSRLIARLVFSASFVNKSLCPSKFNSWLPSGKSSESTILSGVCDFTQKYILPLPRLERCEYDGARLILLTIFSPFAGSASHHLSDGNLRSTISFRLGVRGRALKVAVSRQLTMLRAQQSPDSGSAAEEAVPR